MSSKLIIYQYQQKFFQKHVNFPYQPLVRVRKTEKEECVPLRDIFSETYMGL